MEWQSIKTAPVDGTAVLVVAPGFGVGVGWYFDVVNQYGDHRSWYAVSQGTSDDRAIRLAPTHWMPLPDAPVDTLRNGQDRETGLGAEQG